METEKGIRATVSSGVPTIGARIRVSNVALLHFLEWTHSFPSRRWVFRGHRDACTKLIPRIGRLSRGYDNIVELQLFTMFKLRAVQFALSTPTTDLEWLALAQHHGLPTRLLDWTHNPLVAAFFACYQEPKSTGGVAAIDTDKIEYTNTKGSPFAITSTKMVLGQPFFGRIINQQGLFSIHSQPDRSLDSTIKPEWYQIPASEKPALLMGLANIGIDHSFVMPDLDGLARNLTWMYESKRFPMDDLDRS